MYFIERLLTIGRYGKPKRLRTDNEAVFTGFVFTTFLKLAGIQHQRIQTCAPWQNGRMERLFGTLKPLLRQLVIPDKEALQLALDEFRLFYNHVRPHQNLGGLTPAEIWNGYSSTDIEQRPPKQATLVQALGGGCWWGTTCAGREPSWRIQFNAKLWLSAPDGMQLARRREFAESLSKSAWGLFAVRPENAACHEPLFEKTGLKPNGRSDLDTWTPQRVA